MVRSSVVVPIDATTDDRARQRCVQGDGRGLLARVELVDLHAGPVARGLALRVSCEGRVKGSSWFSHTVRSIPSRNYGERFDAALEVGVLRVFFRCAMNGRRVAPYKGFQFSLSLEVLPVPLARAEL